MQKLIYVIEDDENIRSLIKIALEGYSYTVMDFETAEESLTAVNEKIPNLIIYDIMLPKMSGTEAVTKLKENNKFKKIPIIMLTAKDSEADKIKGLDNGADDYITKPFGIMELMARIRSVLRRSEYSNDNDGKRELNFEFIKLNLNTREVFVENDIVTLTFKEFEMLKFFILNKNRIISRNEFLNEIWGYEYTGESRTVDIHIKTLRQKLGKAGGYIKTSRGTGYILNNRS